MSEPLGPSSLSTILQDLAARGQFEAAVLSDADGYLLASASQEGAETQAALAAMLRNAATRVGSLSMAPADEVTVRDERGRCLVSRSFHADDRLFVLAVLMRHRKPYRRLTAQAIEAIRQSYRS